MFVVLRLLWCLVLMFRLMGCWWRLMGCWWRLLGVGKFGVGLKWWCWSGLFIVISCGVFREILLVVMNWFVYIVYLIVVFGVGILVISMVGFVFFGWLDDYIIRVVVIVCNWGNWFFVVINYCWYVCGLWKVGEVGFRLFCNLVLIFEGICLLCVVVWGLL